MKWYDGDPELGPCLGCGADKAKFMSHQRGEPVAVRGGFVPGASERRVFCEPCWDRLVALRQIAEVSAAELADQIM